MQAKLQSCNNTLCQSE